MLLGSKGQGNIHTFIEMTKGTVRPKTLFIVVLQLFYSADYFVSAACKGKRRNM